MIAYYKAAIARTKGNTFSVELSRQLDSQTDWYHQKTQHCNGLERAQEVAEQMRLALNATEFAFQITVDAR